MKEKEEIKDISKINYFLNKNQKYLNMVVAGLVLVAGVMLILLPQWQKISQDNISLVPDLRSERDSKLIYLNKLKKLEQELSSLVNNDATDLTKINKILPSEMNTQSLFVEIDKIINDAGFTLQKISINEVKADFSDLIEFQVGDLINLNVFDDRVGALDVTLNVEGGGYNEFKSLLKRIEENVRLMNIISVDFSSLSERGYVGQSGEDISPKNYSFNIRTYFLNKDNVS